jgi:hypothetical protein
MANIAAVFLVADIKDRIGAKLIFFMIIER